MFDCLYSIYFHVTSLNALGTISTNSMVQYVLAAINRFGFKLSVGMSSMYGLNYTHVYISILLVPIKLQK